MTVTSFGWLLRLPAFRRSSLGYGPCFEDDRLLDDDFLDCFVAPLVGSARRVEGVMRYLRGIDWRLIDGLADRHRELAHGVLLVWGARDTVFPVTHARKHGRAVPVRDETRRGSRRPLSRPRRATGRGRRGDDDVSPRLTRPAARVRVPRLAILTARPKARIHAEDLGFLRCQPFFSKCDVRGGGADPARPPPLEGHEEASRRRAARRL